MRSFVATAQRVQEVLSGKVKSLRENKSKLEEAFVYQKAIDGEMYREMRAKLTEYLTLAEMELREAQTDEIEIGAVLDFAQMVLLNVTCLLFSEMQTKAVKKEGLVAVTSARSNSAVM